MDVPLHGDFDGIGFISVAQTSAFYPYRGPLTGGSAIPFPAYLAANLSENKKSLYFAMLWSHANPRPEPYAEQATDLAVGALAE